MGVYIKGIEMPKEGRLTLQISADSAVYVVKSCSITAETYTTDAVPVPPHGRLIDADKLYIKSYWYNAPDCGKTHFNYVPMSSVKYAPTIIPASKEEM